MQRYRKVLNFSKQLNKLTFGVAFCQQFTWLSSASTTMLEALLDLGFITEIHHRQTMLDVSVTSSIQRVCECWYKVLFLRAMNKWWYLYWTFLDLIKNAWCQLTLLPIRYIRIFQLWIYKLKQLHRGTARLSTLGVQQRIISSFFLILVLLSPIFSQFFLIFFFNLILQVGGLPTLEGLGNATAATYMLSLLRLGLYQQTAPCLCT